MVETPVLHLVQLVDQHEGEEKQKGCGCVRAEKVSLKQGFLRVCDGIPCRYLTVLDYNTAPDDVDGGPYTPDTGLKHNNRFRHGRCRTKI